MKKITSVLLLFLGVFTLAFTSSCSNNEGADSDFQKSYLPSAKGKAGEMVLVIDSTQWLPDKSVGGELYRTVLGRTRGVLPQEEPQFTVTQVRPSGFNSILRQARNVMIVTTFDQKGQEAAILRSFFGDGVIQSLKKSDKFFFVKTDAWAQGQTVVLLFAKTEAELREILSKPENQFALSEPFNDLETINLQKRLKKEYSKPTDTFLRRELKVSMHLLDGYKVAENDDNFLWLRHPELSFDNNVFIVKVPYTDQKQFSEEEILKFRDKIAKQYLYGDPSNPDSFVVTEDKVKPEMQKVKIDGRLAIELRGLWKTNNISMGGPFVSYTFTDKTGSYLYYIEGFIYAPGMKKRELVREMEAQLKTFKEID
ncbi:DUF4837 family protein [Flammeovirga kamogawensis]|uniref:DUF4837 family protein n=1 Tax=Flammeovirga kamogawensis TaxID=373891 RepID=A0ABX8GVC2_9BACT|nr:DUF4837 family protein [Flammeovirga kamogawensis]MBB6460966.1 hypothetical protein [Flammeovirga kamogawensis]QWG07539.1 DUF4837 family protein [Flammeovirga kamogawensis]TRX69351.1 DUF4837 family protein [Flammeovirga kamogawensis]